MFIDYKIKNNIKRMGINIFSKNYVSSTNDYLNYSYIRDQTPIIILSNNQRHSRGRRGKKWVNFQGSSLGFSLCLRFNKSLNEYFVLSHLVGISIIEACKMLGNHELTIKWPNDIMQNGKKVCGTLIENLIDSKNSFYSMIGFGFNISIPDNLINFIDGYPANLNMEKNNVDLLVGTTASILLKNIALFEKSGFIPFQKKWNESMYAKNKNVILISKDKEITGELLGIDNKGELQIQTNKKIINISDINYSMRLLG
ncbi:biotin--[acetyl-CoA-carboxylase] ligase [Gammaproteobacteria bacterium]|jgi:BirA family biotin operon repressor/biotin-[acetyl-CoA-carboxylase] ligase|nr:biotin--[acetyl-CoA-carboxylase] ligase [Gammaproteobacteria bacterium]MDB3972793.1 biotin--[acetyl-CoA-carboxylase] ligase [Gammaproteobacteria bacterium]